MTITEFARKAVGVPFKPHRNSYEGWDCWGLIVSAYKEVYNVDLPCWHKEYKSVKDNEKLKQLFKGGIAEKFKQVDTPGVGDVAVVFMRGVPVHAGLMIDRKRMLHVEHGINTCVQRVAEFRLDGYYRYAEFIARENNKE